MKKALYGWMVGHHFNVVYVVNVVIHNYDRRGGVKITAFVKGHEVQRLASARGVFPHSKKKRRFSHKDLCKLPDFSEKLSS